MENLWRLLNAEYDEIRQSLKEAEELAAKFGSPVDEELGLLICLGDAEIALAEDEFRAVVFAFKADGDLWEFFLEAFVNVPCEAGFSALLYCISLTQTHKHIAEMQECVNPKELTPDLRRQHFQQLMSWDQIGSLYYRDIDARVMQTFGMVFRQKVDDVSPSAIQFLALALAIHRSDELRTALCDSLGYPDDEDEDDDTAEIEEPGLLADADIVNSILFQLTEAFPAIYVDRMARCLRAAANRLSA